MRLVNQTPFEVAYLAGRLGHPAHSLTVVVKGTFRLVAKGPAVLAEKPMPFAGDDPEEEEGAQSLRYPLDLVPFKPKTDLIFVGKCHPGLQPVPRCKVALTVGAFTKELMVVGDRIWKADGTASEPKPFHEVDLVYERSFGGPEWPANPVGRGMATKSPPEGSLPNIEDVGRPLVHSSQRLATAGLGPLRRGWRPRVDKVGSYDAAWRKERWPWVPADFDFAHFNAAPEDMQVPYLRGDEVLRFEHLHPTEPVFRSALPGLRVRCLVGLVASAGGPPHDVPMAIDTLWIDMEAQTLVLLWRGWLKVASPDVEGDVAHLFVSSEPAHESPTPRETLTQRLAAALAPPEVIEPDDPPAPPDDADREAQDAAEAEGATAEADAKMRAMLDDAGVDPDHLPAATEEQKKAQAARLAELGFLEEEEAAPAPPWTRERVAAAAAAGESLAGRDLSGLDLSELDLTGADLTDALLTDAKLCRAKAPKAKLDRASLERADLTGANLAGASFARADLTEAKLEGADLTQATLERAMAERAVFRDGRLGGACAKGLSARAADFTAALCAGADFTGANLAGTVLDRSDWKNAVLRDASLHAARGEGIHAEGADLTGVRASQAAAFPNGQFNGAKADRSKWIGADLSGSNLSLGSFERADFSGARLDAAILVGAQMKHAKFSRASLRAAKLMRANLFQANLERANLSGADLTDANLYAAETWNADLAGAALTGANVKGSKLAQEPQ